MNRTPEQWHTLFENIGALWVHDGNPRRPHALLSSGQHSNGFFNGSLIIRKPEVLSVACSDIFMTTPPEYMEKMARPDVVVGSAEGAITMAYETAKQLGAEAIFTEKDSRHGMALKRFSVSREAEVLVVEDVITTGGTTIFTIEALEKAGAHVLPFISCIVNRSSLIKLAGRPIVSLLRIPMPMWDEHECELCKFGSRAIRPKGHWDELTANY